MEWDKIAFAGVWEEGMEQNCGLEKLQEDALERFVIVTEEVSELVGYWVSEDQVLLDAKMVLLALWDLKKLGDLLEPLVVGLV